jgi:hypothetical protein
MVELSWFYKSGLQSTWSAASFWGGAGAELFVDLGGVGLGGLLEAGFNGGGAGLVALAAGGDGAGDADHAYGYGTQGEVVGEEMVGQADAA